MALCLVRTACSCQVFIQGRLCLVVSLSGLLPLKRLIQLQACPRCYHGATSPSFTSGVSTDITEHVGVQCGCRVTPCLMLSDSSLACEAIHACQVPMEAVYPASCVSSHKKTGNSSLALAGLPTRSLAMGAWLLHHWFNLVTLKGRGVRIGRSLCHCCGSCSADLSFHSLLSILKLHALA